MRFDAFEADLHARELRKFGIKLKLGAQPFDLLAILLDTGSVVTREEIRLRLWNDKTVVEFEHSINITVNRVRTALGEPPGGELYIETLRGRGYRFMREVTAAPETAEPAAAFPLQPFGPDGRGFRSWPRPWPSRPREWRYLAPCDVAARQQPDRGAAGGLPGFRTTRVSRRTESSSPSSGEKTIRRFSMFTSSPWTPPPRRSA